MSMPTPMSREWLDVLLGMEYHDSLPIYTKAYRRGYKRAMQDHQLSLRNCGYFKTHPKSAFMEGLKDGWERAKEERLKDLLEKPR